MVEAKQINFKLQKSNFTMIGNEMQNSTNFEVIVNHNNIPLTINVKYLGVILDNKLTWQLHIEQIMQRKTLKSLWHDF